MDVVWPENVSARTVAKALLDKMIRMCDRCHRERPIMEFKSSAYGSGAVLRTTCSQCLRLMIAAVKKRGKNVEPISMKKVVLKMMRIRPLRVMI